MNRQDFSELGEEIKNLVQDAIDSQNFDQLSRTIGDVINQTLNDVGQTFNATVNQVGKNINDTIGHVGQNFQQGYSRNFDASRHSHTQKNFDASRPFDAGKHYTAQSSDSARNFGTNREKEPYYRPWKETKRREPNVAGASFPPNLIKNCTSLKIAGTALAATGTSFAGIFGLALMIVAMATRQFSVATAILSVFFGGSLFMSLTGFSMRKRHQRFEVYLRHFKGKTYAAIQDLADAVGKSKRFVVRDLKKMIQKRMFLEGHIDRQGTCMMISDETYQQYQQTLENAKMQQKLQDDQKKQKDTAKKASETSSQKEEYPEEVRKIMEEGHSYIEKIRKCNEEIPGAEISAKLSRLELIVTKIFSRVQEQPDLAPDLKKFMDYYLPTTWKLIDAYRVMDQQPIQGENISSSKKEIENTLDTINEAFENLLDSFFKDTAWDISTDISALQMMLAQEGLTNHDFPGSKKK
ncbi:MAG: 5-bromo-4-chloroindolyl phosphate hydrolysis family protein [Lachnospiraceae bacterium]|nr:5-bromo-4-chloroindolyl phosphate hydrolysis family protein [Robinsoniella sp.]MDY3766800.1 5-bromo-4-chloroindolyl phosphate hydrolysis family protein [Lachnospiraceae bacterium]